MRSECVSTSGYNFPDRVGRISGSSETYPGYRKYIRDIRNIPGASETSHYQWNSCFRWHVHSLRTSLLLPKETSLWKYWACPCHLWSSSYYIVSTLPKEISLWQYWACPCHLWSSSYYISSFNNVWYIILDSVLFGRHQFCQWADPLERELSLIICSSFN